MDQDCDDGDSRPAGGAAADGNGTGETDIDAASAASLTRSLFELQARPCTSPGALPPSVSTPCWIVAAASGTGEEGASRASKDVSRHMIVAIAAAATNRPTTPG
jgi:hypothetical protein